jgi:ribosome recycling factor
MAETAELQSATSVATPASISTQPRRQQRSRPTTRAGEKEIERITHEHVEMIDKAFGRKEHELLEV